MCPPPIQPASRDADGIPGIAVGLHDGGGVVCQFECFDVDDQSAGEHFDQSGKRSTGAEPDSSD